MQREQRKKLLHAAQFIKHELGVEAYIRYMDDFVILSPDKEQLRNWLARIEQFLREELKLEFNPKTTMLAAKNIFRA